MAPLLHLFAAMILVDTALALCLAAQVIVGRARFVEDLALYRLQAMMLDAPPGPCVVLCPCALSARLKHKQAPASTPYRIPSARGARASVARVVLACVLSAVVQSTAVLLSPNALRRPFETLAVLVCSGLVVWFSYGRMRAWVGLLGWWGLVMFGLQCVVTR